MSEGKFSQPRPHRDEERQIEESFRQLTGEKQRRKKVYTTEETIGRTVQDIAAEQYLPKDSTRPLERSARLEQTLQTPPGQTYQPRTPYTAQPRQTYSEPVYEARPRQTYSEPAYEARPRQAQATPGYDPLMEDVDFLLEEDYGRPKPVFQEPPMFREESYPEEEPDFLDRLMNFGAFFRKHQTPFILGLCGAAVLLIVLFVSIFFAGGRNKDHTSLAGNIVIAGVNINGMTRDQAEAAVEEVTDSTYRYQDMVIDLGTAQLTLSPEDTDAQLDVEAAVEAAFAMEPSQEAQYVALLPYLRLNTEYIYETLYTYAEDTGSTLTQTSYGLEGEEPELSADKFNEKAPTQTLVIIMGTPGVGFDAKDVYEKVLDAYSLHEFLVEVENVESVTEPDPIDLEAIYEEFYIEPVNAAINLQDFKTEPGSYGYGFDLEAAQELVEDAQPGEVLRIPMEYIAPEILDNDSFFLDTLGEHQTRGTGNDARNKNLQLSCSALDGTILNPGESLSFSSVLNKVSGFQSAPEDSGQEDVNQGGVTQLSSTLYYAALMSDLNVNSRSSHSYLPSFIDYGLDAKADLKITNTTGYPIQINASYSGGYVKVEILGTEERDYYVMLESSISSSTAAQTVYEEYPYDNDEGYEDGDVIEEGSAGYLVKSYKVKYDRKTGKELSRDFITNSQYPAVDRVVARVEDPPETEPPTEEPTEPSTEEPWEEPTEPYPEESEPEWEDPYWETDPEWFFDSDHSDRPDFRH